MTATAAAPIIAEEPGDTDGPITLDLERAVVTTLAGVYDNLEVSVAEYEESVKKDGKEVHGADPIGLTYADAMKILEGSNAVERSIRRLGLRYRQDVEAAVADAADRAQEPFNGKERVMLRRAIADYADSLEKEGKKLQGMGRDGEARTILSDAAVLRERIQPLFAEQLDLKGDHGPLFAGGEPMATKAPAKVAEDGEGDKEGDD